MEPVWHPDSYTWDGYALFSQQQQGMHANADNAALMEAMMSGGAGMHVHPPTVHRLAVPGALAKLSKPAPGKKGSFRPACQVAGCCADLSHSRAYYKRYRICETHFRAPTMVIDGKVMRFCQQCAKFEPIVVFEGDKRSCKRQLDRHNERRKGRKARDKRGAGAEGSGADSAADDSDDSTSPGAGRSGRGVDAALADLLQTSSIQRSASAALAPSGPVHPSRIEHQRPPSHYKPVPLTAFQQHALAGGLFDDGPPGVAVGLLDDGPFPTGGMPVPSHAAAAVPQGGGAQPAVGAAGSPPSRSEGTVEAGAAPASYMMCDALLEEGDGCDSLAAAALQMVTMWQEQEEAAAAAAASAAHCAATTSTGAPSSQQGSHPCPMPGGHTVPGSAADPPSADSSVHGPQQPPAQQPPASSIADAVVMELFGTSEMFDTVRADALPVVREVVPNGFHHSPTLPEPPPEPTPPIVGPQHAAQPGSQPLSSTGAAHHPDLRGVATSRINGGMPDNLYYTQAGSVGGGAGYAGAPPGAGGQAASPYGPPGPWTTRGASSAGNAHPAPVLPGHEHGPMHGWSGGHQGPGGPALVPPYHAPHARVSHRGSDAAGPGQPSSPTVPLHPLLASLPAAEPAGPLVQEPTAAAHAAHARAAPAAQDTVRYPSMWAAQQGPAPAPGPAPGPHVGEQPWRDAPMHPPPGIMLSRRLGQASYMLAEQSLTRLTIKLHGITPDALPADLRGALMDWLLGTDARLLQGFIRPGCVHLSLDCMLMGGASKGTTTLGSGVWTPQQPGGNGGVRDVDDLLPTLPGTPATPGAGLPRSLAHLFSNCTIVELQSPRRLVLMEGVAVWNTASLDKRPQLPAIHAVSPLVLLAGRPTPQTLTVRGDNLEPTTSRSMGGGTAGAGNTASTACQVFVRSQGSFLQTGAAALVPETASDGSEGDAEEAEEDGSHGGRTDMMGAAGASRPAPKPSTWGVAVDTSRVQPGLASVEVQAGRLMSNWRPVLVVHDAGVAHEVSHLEPLQALFPDRIATFITDLALLLQLQSACRASAAQRGARYRGAARRARRSLHCPAPAGEHDCEDSDGSMSHAASDDDDDDDPLTAPSISEGEGDGWGSEHEDADMEAPVEEYEEQQSETLPQLPGVGGNGLGNMQPAGHHPMSWDSEAGFVGEAGTPMLYSSWGSTLTTSALAAAGCMTGVSAPCSGDDTRAAAALPHLVSRPAMMPHPMPSPSDAFSPEMRVSIVARALRLLAFACDAGWPSTTRLIVDLLTTLPLLPAPQFRGLPVAQLAPWQLAPCAAQEVLASTLGADGLTPLHRAARSGSAATVRELLGAATEAGLALNLAARGGAALSPLHFAAIAGDGGQLAGALLTASRDAPLQWFLARDKDGRTPAQHAESAGCSAINKHARFLVHILAHGKGRAPRGAPQQRPVA